MHGILIHPCSLSYATLPSLLPLPDFHSTYTLGEILGKGVFSTVRAATVTRPGPNKGMMVAVKCVPKKDLPRDDEEELLQEVRDGLAGRASRGVERQEGREGVEGSNKLETRDIRQEWDGGWRRRRQILLFA